jgi:peptidase E
MARGTILAMGGGGFSMEPDNPLLDDFALSLAREPEAPEVPRVCFVPTASGDAESYIDRFLTAFPPTRARSSVLRLFTREHEDLRSFVLAQDVIYVGGGSTANLLAVWRVHRLDELLVEALESGVLLTGLSAGMNCWFEGSVTDSFGADRLHPLDDGLGMLAGSACPHYDGEAARRPAFRGFVAGRRLPAGYAADDGCGLLFRDGELVEAVASRPAARAFRVDVADGSALETPIATRYLGDRA